MNRRSFLASTVAACAVPAWPAALRAAPTSAATALVLTGISAETEPAQLFAVLDALLARDIWLTCTVRLPEPGQADYVKLLQQLDARAPALELAIEIEDLAALSPYFQARAAFEARGALEAALATSPRQPLRTVLCAPAEKPTAPTGVRSAGLRNVLVLPQASGPTRSQHWPSGVARFFGGELVHPWSADVTFPVNRSSRILYLPSQSFAQFSPETLGRWAMRLAQRLFDAELSARISLMPVAEIQFRDDFRFTRLVAVQLVGPRAGPFAAFASWLEARGIPLREAASEAETGYWVSEKSDEGGGGQILPVRLGCDSGGNAQVEAADPLPPGVGIMPVPATTDRPGLDGCALLHLPEHVVAAPIARGAALAPSGPADDFILTIRAEVVTSRFDLLALQAAFKALAEDGVTSFVDINQMANAVLPHTPIDTRHRRTTAARLSAEKKPAALSAAERAALMEDARRAWAYFETFTDPGTGLIPATVDLNDREEALKNVTMWDVGSQINGLVAARQIGLIDAAAFERAIARILPQIAGRRSQDRLLPQGWIRTDRDRWGTDDFDGCDVGRLLAALDNLRRHSDFGDALVTLVESWDLPAIIIDREIHSVTDGALSSTFSSHCSHYAARAFGRWGLDVASPYRTFDGRPPADGEVALMEVTAGIGPLGAEPLLLEAMELGMSRESAFLAEVLHVAQLEEFEATGDLVAVSETPIKQSPWFIYQGLQLGREAREWAIDTVDRKEEYRTKGFLAEVMAVSSKAAFLWAAYRPGPYSDALLDYVRANARMEIGFASNINRATGEATANYTDLNTNGIILQAIAHILRSRRAQ